MVAIQIQAQKLKFWMKFEYQISIWYIFNIQFQSDGYTTSNVRITQGDIQNANPGIF